MEDPQYLSEQQKAALVKMYEEVLPKINIDFPTDKLVLLGTGGTRDCCDDCKVGNMEGCQDYGGFNFASIFKDDISDEAKETEL